MNPALARFDPVSVERALLPVRVQPLFGEAFEAFCARVAQANDVSSAELIQLCKSKRPAAKTPMQAVAEAVGVEPDNLEFLTIDATRRAVRKSPAGWRLRTTVWVCPSSGCRAITDALRGFATQFLCLRCNRFLVPASESATVGGQAEDTLIQVQWDLLDAMTLRSNDQVRQRLIRLRRSAFAIGTELLRNNFRDLFDERRQQSLRQISVSKRWNESALGIPEDPELVGATLNAAWEISASSHMTYLAVNALGDRQFPDYQQWKLYSRGPNPAPRASLSGPPAAVVAAGMRIRQLVKTRGLTPERVPNEIRRAGDPMILDEDTWRWRRHVCTQLRLWLINLEIGEDVIASRRNNQPASDRVLARQRELGTAFWEWQELIVPYVKSRDAAHFLSQIIELAEQTAMLGRGDLGDPRVQLSDTTFRNLAPTAAKRIVPRGVVDFGSSVVNAS